MTVHVATAPVPTVWQLWSKKPEPLVVSGKLPIGVTAEPDEMSVMVTSHVEAVFTMTGGVHVIAALVDLPRMAMVIMMLLF